MSCIQIRMFASSNIPAMHKDGETFVFDTDLDFDIKLSKFIEGLTDVNKIKVDGVLGFELKDSVKNRVVLKKYVDPHNYTARENPIVVQVWASSLHYIRFHDLYITGFKDKKYQCELRTGSEHWIFGATKLKLNEINLTDEEKIAYSKANVTSYNLQEEYVDDTIGIRFPMVNYGKFTYAGRGLQLNDFRPFVSILWILQRGFCQIGWKFRSTILETNYGRRLIAYLLDKDFGSDPAKIKLLRANLLRDSASNVALLSGSNGATVNFTKPIENDGNHWNSSSVYADPGFYDGSGIVDIEITLVVRSSKLVVTVGKRNITFRLEMRMRNSFGLDVVLQEVTETSEFQFWANDVDYNFLKLSAQDVQIDAGSEVYFRFYWSTNMEANNYEVKIMDKVTLQNTYISQLTFTPKQAFVQEDDEFLIEKLLRPDKFLEFVKGVTHLFNGKFDTDFKKNEVWFYPSYDVTIWNDDFVEGYFKTTVNRDISETVQCDKEEIINPNSELKRYIQVKFNGSGDAAIKEFVGEKKSADYLSYTVDNGDQYVDETETLENPYFEATYNGLVDGLDVATGSPVNMPFMMESYDIENPKQSFDIKPRVLYWAGSLSQRHKTLLAGHPDNMAFNYVQIFDNLIAFNLPCSWQESGDQEYSRFIGGSDLSPSYPAKAKRVENVAYGERLAKDDLFHFFYQRYIYDMKINSSIKMLLFLSNPQFLNYGFREMYTFNILGRTVLCRLISIDDFSVCSATSTPATFMPIVSAFNTCAIIPDSGGETEIFCSGNAPTLEITKTGSCYDFGIGGTSVSPIASVTYEYKYSGTDVWVAASSLCDPTSGFEVRIVVDYADDCDTISRYRFVDACGNSPEITADYNYGDNCFTAEVIGVFVSESHTTVLTYSFDGGDTWLPYTDGTCVEVDEGVTLIKIHAVVSYPDGCEDEELDIELDIPPGEVDCDSIDADVECTTGGLFIRTGSVVGPEALDIIEYRQPGDTVWRIFDEVNSIFPCPFEYRRVIFYCNDVCPIYCGPIHTCECSCDEELTIECVDKILTVVGPVSTCTIEWTGPSGFTASGNDVMLTVAGTYEATVTCGACIYEISYIFTPSNAGTGTDVDLDSDGNIIV